MRFMSKRQYTKSPYLRQAKVGIGGCFGERFGEAQRGIVLKKRGSDNNLTEGGAARPPPNGEGAKREGCKVFREAASVLSSSVFLRAARRISRPSRLTHFVRCGGADDPDLPRPTLSFLRSAFGSFPYPSVSRSHFLLCFILRQDAGALGRCRGIIFKSKRKPANCSNNVLDIR